MFGRWAIVVFYIKYNTTFENGHFEPSSDIANAHFHVYIELANGRASEWANKHTMLAAIFNIYIYIYVYRVAERKR